MNAVLRLLGTGLFPRPHSLADPYSEAFIEDFKFTEVHMNEEISKLTVTTDQPTAHSNVAPAPKVYRSWLSRLLFGKSPIGSPRGAQVPVDADGWVLIDQIKKDGPTFADMWNSEVTGDWTELFEESPPAFQEIVVPRSRVEELGTDRLRKWALENIVDPAEHEAERMSIWSDFASRHMASSDLPGYLDSVVLEVPDNMLSAIHVDVERTLPADLRPRMERVLTAYSVRNPSVGFCQGMSYLVSLLLQQHWVTNEMAFDLLSAFVEQVNANYYADDLGGLHMDLRRLYKFLFYLSRDRPLVPLELLLVEPMMAAFTRVMPTASAARVVDVGFSHGKIGLFAVYLAVLDLTSGAVREAIAKSPDPAEEIVNGAVAFRTALTQLDISAVLIRADAFLISHRAKLEELIASDLSVETEEEIEYVISSSTAAPMAPMRINPGLESFDIDSEAEEEESSPNALSVFFQNFKAVVDDLLRDV